MLYAQILLLLVLLAIALVAPGFWLVRRLNWPPLETLAASLGTSLVLVYLVSFALYVLGWGAIAFWAVTAGFVALGILARRDLARLAAPGEARRASAAFGLLFAWGFALLALVRNYSLGDWTGDWYEHFQRTRFFLMHLPKDSLFLFSYLLPTRPPLFNLVESFFLAQTANRFEIYQVACLALNLLPLFPLALLVRRLAGPARDRLPLLAGLLALCPMFMQNATYTWTRGATNFFVLLGLHFYLEGWRRPDRTRMVAAFASLSAGVLTHYSAGPYLFLFGIHYAVFLLRRRADRWRELGMAGGASLGLLGTWFGWSSATFGIATTFGANSTVHSLGESSASAVLARMALNLLDTVVPFPLCGVGLARLGQTNLVGRVRDWTGLLYETNLLGPIGSAGGLILLYLLVARWRRSTDPGGRAFWAIFIPACVIVSVPASGERDPFGVAHICLQPLLLLGIALLAAEFPRMPGALRALAVAGATADFALGIFLHFSLQNALPGVSPRGMAPTWQMQLNWQLKKFSAESFLGDHLAGLSLEVQTLVLAAFGAILLVLAREARVPRETATHDAAPAG